MKGVIETVHKFIIEGAFYGKHTLPALNDYLKECNKNRYAGSKMKKECQRTISIFARKYLKRLTIEKPVIIHYHFYEYDKLRDKSNVASLAMKFIEDALQECKILKNDNWKCVENFDFTFAVDKSNPRIEVELEEVDA